MIIAVHVGAGKHSVRKEAEYKELMKRAINEGMKESGLLETLVKIISILEDSCLTNAGFGSNLTRTGTVECDASISWLNNFGSVTCCKNIKNPIKAASLVLRNGLKEKDNGLVPPLTISNNEGLNLLQDEMNEELEEANLVSNAKYEKYFNLKQNYIDTEDTEELLFDTVGAVCLDEKTGEIISGVSSGGIWLKYPGRIGEAAVYGAGCWTEQNENMDFSCGVSVSGTGEQIVQAFAAKELSQSLYKGEDAVRKWLNEFLDTQKLDKYSSRNIGFIALTQESNITQFWFGHTTVN